MWADGRRGIHFSELYMFSYLQSFQFDDSLIGQEGYSRVVYCNDPDNPEALQLKYRGNYVSTTKYTALNFIPKSLFEQFRRVANIYFLVVACFSFSPLAPYRAGSIVLPLVVVIGATMVKEAVEDWRRRKQDIEANNRTVKVYGKDHTFQETRWKNLRVGDLVRVEKDEFFPADLLLLSSSYDDGICYVETMNLDGETNLKVKRCLEATAALHDDFSKFKAIVKCEDPNEHLYSFIGNFYFGDRHYPLSPHQILLRGSKLRNTDFIYGVVIFCDHDTKVMQNTINPPSKRSKVEKKMDKIVYFLFSVLVLISSIGSVLFGVRTKNDISGERYKRWYLRPDSTTVFFDPRRDSLAAFCHFLTGLMLYGYLIPISLYVSIEVVKVLQTIFINQDKDMYYAVTNKPVRARTSNLNEDLGQVDTILSDKTGTLTCNSMQFVKCSIAGTAYGRGITEVEKTIKIREKNGSPESVEAYFDIEERSGNVTDSIKSIKGFNFRDERIMEGKWINEPCAVVIQNFFRVLAICHTAIPDEDKDSHEISYEAESPDEAAFVIAARELGFEFYERRQTSILLRELDPKAGKKVHREYKLLHILEFSSSRKRMSVIVRNEENQLLLLCKGADSVMFERLSKAGQIFEVETKDHIDRYSAAGLRTMVIAYRLLDEQDYAIWREDFFKAKTSVSADRDTLVDAAADKIERELILLGATAVEDKLQMGVPECVEKLSQAGVKIWVLTGDKMETAVNIGYACRLLREEMCQIVITLDGPDMIALEKQGDKEAIAKAVMASDFAIGQFCFLEHLLLVHGHWSYRRITMMICYFFYKDITFGLTLFWFETYASFSSQPAYNDWCMSFYNVFFTSLPVIALGIFDQDVSASLCLEYPQIYQEGLQFFFSWARILAWMFNGVTSSAIIFFFITSSVIHQAFRRDGQVAGYDVLGVTLYTCVVWTVNCQMALVINYFTWIQHFFIWGSIIFWYIFLVIYGFLPPTLSTTAYRVLVEACASSPLYWLATFFVVVSALIPYFLCKALQIQFFPMYHSKIHRAHLKR
ncbi:probable phospholipid-transporting ATPase 8 isoform X3 [Macadamia integrifolia]|uniref:probable phospholipid-transporting ATPase 8 isoform X3 n=1 Tax=Macadamia integrifolia TaxID=60698 RepID=UPI001C4F301F|nr:probable phospholipid-transporting ATPase 8 isoform X3 [Macadamia integrifolia]